MYKINIKVITFQTPSTLIYSLQKKEKFEMIGDAKNFQNIFKKKK